MSQEEYAHEASQADIFSDSRPDDFSERHRQFFPVFYCLDHFILVRLAAPTSITGFRQPIPVKRFRFCAPLFLKFVCCLLYTSKGRLGVSHLQLDTDSGRAREKRQAGLEGKRRFT